MTWRKILPNLITLGALLASFFCIVAAARGQFELAAQLIMLTLILDGLDGIMARLIRGTSKLGAELDTFVDMTGYGIAPAMILYYLIVPEAGVWAMILVVLTLFSGAIRLSRFRIVDPFRGQHGYMGLPITCNAGWVAMIVILSSSSGRFDSVSITSGFPALVIWGISAAMVFLQVSRVRYGKPVKNPAVFILGAVLTIMLFMDAPFRVPAAYAFSALGVYYAFISPFLIRGETAAAEGDDADDVVSPRPS